MGWFFGYATLIDSEFLNSVIGMPSTEKLKQRHKSKSVGNRKNISIFPKRYSFMDWRLDPEALSREE